MIARPVPRRDGVRDASGRAAGREAVRTAAAAVSGQAAVSSVFVLGIVVVVVLATLARPAAAYDFVLSSRTVGQGYQERRYGVGGAAELLSRRRLTQYLSLSVFDIEPAGWRGEGGDRNLISLELGMRFDSDFGTYMTRRPSGLDAIRELSQNQLDLLFAYLLARDVGGHLDLQIGRQLHYDLVDFYSFDGVDALVHLGPFISAQAFGGTEVRGDLPLSAPLYELDGTSVGSRDPATRPAQSGAWRPMVGGALAFDQLSRASPVTARVAYRRVFSPTVDAQPGDPPSAINHETLSFTADAHWRDRLFLSAGARYNLLVAAWDDQQLALRWRIGRRHLVSAEYSYLAPTFDGDSIWNIFSPGAYRDVRASYDVELTTAWRAHVRGFWRHFVDPPETPPDLAAAAPGGARAFGGNVGVEVRGVRGRARVDGYADTGFGGWKVGGDASGRWVVRPNLLDLEGRLTATGWRADDVPDPRDAFMVGGAVGFVYHLGHKMRVHFLGENNSGTYYRAQLRGLGVLEMDVTL